MIDRIEKKGITQGVGPTPYGTCLKMNSIFFWTTSPNLFPQFERRHCCLSSPDGQPRSLAGPVCVREPLCLLKRSPPFSILVWQSLVYSSLDQVCFFSNFHVTINYIVAFYHFTFKHWPPFSLPWVHIG